MYSHNLKSITIENTTYRLIELDGVPTWCHYSGAVITDQSTMDTIRDHEWNRA